MQNAATITGIQFGDSVRSDTYSITYGRSAGWVEAPAATAEQSLLGTATFVAVVELIDRDAEGLAFKIDATDADQAWDIIARGLSAEDTEWADITIIHPEDEEYANIDLATIEDWGM